MKIMHIDAQYRLRLFVKNVFIVRWGNTQGNKKAWSISRIVSFYFVENGEEESGRNFPCKRTIVLVNPQEMYIYC